MKNNPKKYFFPLLGALLVSLYFVYIIIFDGEPNSIVEILLLPVEFPLYLLELFSSRITLIIGIPVTGFILFALYQYIFKEMKSAKKLRSKIFKIFIILVVLIFLSGLANLLVSTGAFVGARNVFTNECAIFGGNIPIGYKHDETCQNNRLPNPSNVVQ